MCVLNAGVVVLAAAWELNRAGRDVTVIDCVAPRKLPVSMTALMSPMRLRRMMVV